MTTIKLRFRPSAAIDKQGTIYHQVIHRRRVAMINTGCHIYPHEWDIENADLRTEGNNARRTATLRMYRAELTWKTAQMTKIVEEKEQGQTAYTIDELTERFRNIPQYTSVFKHIRTQIERKMKMRCYGTAKTYESALRSFGKFRNDTDLSFEDMTSELIQQYEAWMLHTGLKRSSAACHMRTLRTLYRLAADEQLTDDNDIFRKVHVSIGKTRKRAISAEMISAIQHLDLTDKPSLDFARNIFMFSFYTRGMSFVDIAHLRKSNLRNGFLTYNRQKTFQCLTIQWERSMQNIIDMYAKETRNSPYLFPIIKGDNRKARSCYEQALQRVNRNLKHIGSIVGLNIPLSTYVARHSWASIARGMDVPLSVISEGLGHDSDKTTQIYLASLDTSMVNKANRDIIDRITTKG